jgi:hypothetical protein
MSIYSQSIEEIHSFDAAYKSVVLRNNNLVIPYINLGVSNHPLYKSEKGLQFIDYAYMVFRDVFYLSVYIGRRYNVIGTKKGEETLYFGGKYLESDSCIFNDLEICCREVYLQTLDFTQLSSAIWIPFPTPKFSTNMQAKMVENFFSGKLMPESVKNLIA